MSFDQAERLSSKENLFKNDLSYEHKFKWDSVKSELKNEFKSIIWNSWVEPLTFSNYSDSELIILTTSELIKNRIERQYYDQIFLHSKKYFADLNKIKFLVNEINAESSLGTKNNLKSVVKNQSDKNHLISFVSEVSKSLNKSFTFENFVVGDSNDLAFFSAKKVVQNFSSNYNPLFLYGGVGLGKTHLLNSIAWEIQNEGKRKFIYMSAERFMYQFIKSIKFKETISFKEQFRSVDVLMIDDLQFIGGKESTQQEFFHLFNDLIDMKKQIIITADKSPNDILDMDLKLKSRLSGGLVVDILPTDNLLRTKIIKKKLMEKNSFLDSEIIKFLADKITNNVRELEGAINKIIAYSDLMKINLDLNKAQVLLVDFLRTNIKVTTIQDIQFHVSKYFNINFSDLCSKSRSRFISRPRQIAMFLSKELTEFSYPDIGKLFGGKDHTTVIHAVNKIKNLSLIDKKIKKDIENLTLTLKS
tara:strand:- start:2915 stop:4336 length:1422 start_codon:yes stop_codon:yes gene_type:complete